MPVLLVGIGSLILTPVWYRSAVTSCSYWDSTVRALVDVGRVPLASALGFALPSTIERERKMWNLVVSFTYYGFNERWASRLDEFRVGAPTTSDGASIEGPWDRILGKGGRLMRVLRTLAAKRSTQ